MPYVNIHAHITEPIDTNTSDSIRKYVKHLDDNVLYFGEKLSQFYCELVVKHLKIEIFCQMVSNIHKARDFVLCRNPVPLQKNALAFR